MKHFFVLLCFLSFAFTTTVEAQDDYILSVHVMTGNGTVKVPYVPYTTQSPTGQLYEDPVNQGTPISFPEGALQLDVYFGTYNQVSDVRMAPAITMKRQYDGSVFITMNTPINDFFRLNRKSVLLGWVEWMSPFVDLTQVEQAAKNKTFGEQITVYPDGTFFHINFTASSYPGLVGLMEYAQEQGISASYSWEHIRFFGEEEKVERAMQPARDFFAEVVAAPNVELVNPTEHYPVGKDYFFTFLEFEIGSDVVPGVDSLQVERGFPWHKVLRKSYIFQDFLDRPLAGLADHNWGEATVHIGEEVVKMQPTQAEFGLTIDGTPFAAKTSGKIKRPYRGIVSKQVAEILRPLLIDTSTEL